MLRAAVLAAAVPFVVGFPGCSRYHVPSSSMEPTLHCGGDKPGCLGESDDGLEVEQTKRFRRGDIVIFATPPKTAAECGSGGTFVKRVIGLGGETIGERGGVIFVDGRRLHEPYVSRDFRVTDNGRWHVPRDSYFVLGDARAQSCDSRVWGSVPAENMIAKVVAIDRGSKRIAVR